MLTYNLKAQIGQVIIIVCRYDLELIGEVVDTNLQSGKLVIQNVRKFNAAGAMETWLHSVADGTPIDVGLSQDKMFLTPSNDTMVAYNIIFP